MYTYEYPAEVVLARTAERKRIDAETSAKITRLRNVVEGFLHFDDALTASGPAGEALKQWRAEARRALDQT